MKRTISILLMLALLVSSLFALCSCDEKDGCVYASERDVSEHEIYYVSITFRDFGEVVVLLDATTAPVTVENFLKLVSEGFYDGLTIHRVIENFMIQGGDPDADGTGGSADKIYGEFALNGHENDISHLRGVISMARANAYNSASSQFFICNADATALDGQYAAFGYVVDGMSVIDEITEVTSKYTDAYYYNGIIYDTTKQAVIEKIEILDNYK